MHISEETLFERLRQGRAARDPSLSLDRARLRKSIAENLQRIFTSREMHAPAQPEYGMPDPGEILHALQGGPELMRKKLKLCVEQFEPRLTDVKVLHVETVDFGHTLHFTVRAVLRGMPSERLSLDATVEPSGEVRVHP
ncbi:MAG TPA: type VI secretion system baseplate subunit TssE [Planctomycetota bacterium]|nr:type VI secretion system baseplate subunit TssE [Planctomycetota bacterium]